MFSKKDFLVLCVINFIFSCLFNDAASLSEREIKYQQMKLVKKILFEYNQFQILLNYFDLLG